jgi:hypothetical protein
VKKNLEYLDEFERAEHGPNAFDVEQARDATSRCAGIHRDIAALRDAIAAIPPCHLKKESRTLCKIPDGTRKGSG